MKFRLREGFNLFRTVDEAVEFETRGERESGVTPVVREGEIKDYSRVMHVLQALQRQGALGRLEPIDTEAFEFYGDTQPQIAARITHPERYAQREYKPEWEQ